MTNILTRAQAKKWTMGAQLASGVCVFGAIALGVVGLPAANTQGVLNAAANSTMAPSSATNPNTIDQGNNADSKQSTQIDTLGLAQRFSLLNNAPVSVNNVVISDPEPTIADPDSSIGSEIAKRVRYIGFINEPENFHAFIRIDGKQRVVTVGSIAKAGQPGLADLTVERISATLIVLTDGKGRARVKLADRIGQSITMVTGTKVDVTPAAVKGSLLTPEDEARIAAMPPRQQPGARRRLERERRGLDPADPPVRITKPLVEVRAGFSKNTSQSPTQRRNNRNQRND